jgi:hypothetical protein
MFAADAAPETVFRHPAQDFVLPWVTAARARPRPESELDIRPPKSLPPNRLVRDILTILHARG